MPTFQYEAINSQGQTVKDQIVARDTDDAVAKIKELNLFPTRIKQLVDKRARVAGKAGQPGRRKGGAIVIGGVRNKDLTLFTRQFSTLTDAGIPVVRSLNILEEQMRPCALKNIVGDVASDVESGSSLSEAMSHHPRAFDDLYVNMVKAGEAGGVLDVVLQRLADFREKAARLKRRIIGAMVYPVAVITFATLILAGIIMFIIPRFMDMFKELKVDLPVPTQILLAISDFAVRYWFVIPLAPVCIFMFFKAFKATKTGRRIMDRVKFSMPVFGSIIRKASISRFARTFGTLISSGVPILEALNITRDTAGNVVLANAISQVHDSIREGEPIAGPLSQTKVCDEIVVNMIDVGEETGNLDNMLIKVADTYDDQVDTAVESMRSLMEPIMIIVLGIIIGFIVISLFLPLIKIMSSLS